MAPSFERLDYLLRANKNMERKLVFDVLLHGQQLLKISDPVYVGLGSMWFADFRLAHRVLGLEAMISIERKTHAARADFNKPYASISVREGDCLPVLRTFTADDWRNPLFAWLDFDGRLTEDVVGAIDVFLEKCAVNSVLVVTVNGLRRNYSPHRISDNREQTSVSYIEGILGGGVVHPRFEPRVTGGGKYEDMEDVRFPEFLADALLNYVAHRVRMLAREASGKQIRFVPLFNICHEDGASMVTVGGAVCTDVEAPVWQRCLTEHAVLASDQSFPRHLKLDLIPITLKEKLTLDACLPHPQEEFLQKVIGAGLKLPEVEIEKYRLFNRHFPVFVESPI